MDVQPITPAAQSIPPYAESPATPHSLSRPRSEHMHDV